MRINRILIENIMGVTHYEFAPGTLTVIRGGNGKGKSSIIRAILWIFEGGSGPGMLRNGAKKGSVKLTLDDGVTITKSLTPSGYKLEAIGPDDLPISKPQDYIHSLAESLSADPAALLTAKPKELLALLLQLMPITFDPAEIIDAIGKFAPDVKPAAPLDLDGIEALRKQIYDARTKQNTIAKENDASAIQLTQTLRDDDSTDWESQAAALEQQKTQAEQEVAAARLAAAKVRSDEAAAVTEAINAQIAQLHEKKQERLREIAQAETATNAAIDTAAAPVLSHIVQALAVARDRAKGAAQNQKTRELIAQQEKRASHSFQQAELFTFAIDALDDLKRQKLDSLPISGLTVEGGKVKVDGVEWERVNTARKVNVAFEISAMRAGKLPFMLLDNAELMDPETWRAFVAAVEASGFQVLAARVPTAEEIERDGLKLTIEPVETGVAA